MRSPSSTPRAARGRSVSEPPRALGSPLIAIARTHALLDERTAVFPEDVRMLAPAVLAHRLGAARRGPGHPAGRPASTPALARIMSQVSAPGARRR